MTQEKKDRETIRENPSYFLSLPPERKTENVCWEAVNADAENIRHVDEGTLTYEIVGIALSSKPEVLREIPHEALKNLLPYILNDNDEMLATLPKDVLTADLYHAIVKENGHNLQHVPEGMKTPELCRTAFFSTQDLGFDHCAILNYIPYPEVCLEGLKDSINSLDAIDLAHTLRPEVINKEIAGFLVGHDGCCLSCIPVHLQTEELAMQAVSVSGNQALSYTTVREDLKTEKVYLAGMGKDSFQSYLHIPEQKRTPEICLVAEKLYPQLFEKRPEVIPEHVKQGCNIYTLSKTLEGATGKKYDVEEVKRLYNGGTLRADRFITPGGTLRNQKVYFDKEKKEFSFKPLKQEKRKGFRR